MSGPQNDMIVFSCSNKSLDNTTITSPDGQTIYTIESPLEMLRRGTTTLSVQHGGVSAEKEEVASIQWKTLGSDILTLRGKPPVLVKEAFPKKWHNWLWPGRTMSNEDSDVQWKGERCPELVDQDGSVLASYNKKLLGREAATLAVTTSMADEIEQIILGVLVVHQDAARRRFARSAGYGAGGSA